MYLLFRLFISSATFWRISIVGNWFRIYHSKLGRKIAKAINPPNQIHRFRKYRVPEEKKSPRTIARPKTLSAFSKDPSPPQCRREATVAMDRGWRCARQLRRS